MSSSESSPTNTTSTTTNASESNVAATNTQGVTVLGNKGSVALSSDSHNITLNTTSDQGAVQAGSKLGQLAISSNTGLTETVAGNSFDFANHALDVVSSSQANSANLVAGALSWGGNILQSEQQALQQNQAANNAQLGNVASTLGAIAVANDTSQASQSTTFAQNALKIGAIVIVGVLAVVIIVVNRK
jgi:hypothetical protein